MFLDETPDFLGLTPWLCDYHFMGVPDTIVLYSSSPQQLERDFQHLALEVIGESVGSVDY